MKTGTFQTHTTTGFYPLHYKIWGDDNRETLVCSAGLLGNSDDFKFVGETLAGLGYRIVSLDMPGRGLSAYFKDSADYNYRQYISDLNNFLVLIGCSEPHSCDWFGVSMGGLLGIRLAGMENSPIRRLILSDVGPEVPQFDLDFILKVMSSTPEYKTPEDALPFFKMALGTPYSRGPMNDAQWLYMVNTALKKRADGMYIRNFDPALADMFAREPLGEIPLWPFWDKI
ncbi:MAG: alpha/beta hydrolase, partial [Pseudomonadota bacterium]